MKRDFLSDMHELGCSVYLPLTKTPKEFLLRLVDNYGGYNIILKKICTKTKMGAKSNFDFFTGRKRCWNTRWSEVQSFKEDYKLLIDLLNYIKTADFYFISFEIVMEATRTWNNLINPSKEDPNNENIKDLGGRIIKHDEFIGIEGEWLTPTINARYEHYHNLDDSLPNITHVYEEWAKELDSILSSSEN